MKTLSSLLVVPLILLSAALWEPSLWQASAERLDRVWQQQRLIDLDRLSHDQSRELAEIDAALTRARARVGGIGNAVGIDEVEYATDQSQQKLKQLRKNLPAARSLVDASVLNGKLEQQYRGEVSLIEGSKNHESVVRELETELLRAEP